MIHKRTNDTYGLDSTYPFVSNIELDVVCEEIKKGDIVFDVGANVGGWTKAVLDHIETGDIKIHAFEPTPDIAETYKKRFESQIAAGTIKINQQAVYMNAGETTFYLYRDSQAFNTAYRRNAEFEAEQKQPVLEIVVKTTTIDAYCKKHNIDRIDFLKIDVEGAEVDVINGAREMIAAGKVAKIQFEYGGCFKDAGKTLKEIADVLFPLNYTLMKMSFSGDRKIFTGWADPMEDYDFSNYLAIAPSAKSALLKKPKKIILWQDWGGLGDNIQLSTLPEMFFKKYGEKCVWISTRNAYRFEGIKELVWDANPYIAGYSDEEPNAGIAKGHVYQDVCNKNHIRGVEKIHGLEPTNDYPKIYYKFKEEDRAKYADKIFIDLTASNQNPQIQNKNIGKRLMQYLKKEVEPLPNDVFVLYFKEGFTRYPLTLTQLKGPRYPNMPENFGPKHPEWKVPSKRAKFEAMRRRLYEPYKVKDIFEYANIIKHCKRFICLFSGGNALASALRQDAKTPEVVCFVNECYLTSWNGAYVWPNVQYVAC